MCLSGVAGVVLNYVDAALSLEATRATLTAPATQRAPRHTTRALLVRGGGMD